MSSTVRDPLCLPLTLFWSGYQTTAGVFNHNSVLGAQCVSAAISKRQLIIVWHKPRTVSIPWCSIGINQILLPPFPIPSSASYEQRRPIQVLRTTSSIEPRRFLMYILLSSLCYWLHSFTNALIVQQYQLIFHVSTCTIAIGYLPRWQRWRGILEFDGFATTHVLSVGLVFRYGMIRRGTDTVQLGLGSCASRPSSVEDLVICSCLQYW